MQLQHRRSGLFLTALATAAPLDPDCRGLALRLGTSHAVFKFMPKYKAQTEGSVVYYKHFMVTYIIGHSRVCTIIYQCAVS